MISSRRVAVYKFRAKQYILTKILGKTINQKILRLYFLIVLLGGILLSLPFSQQSWNCNFYDSFFIAISAFTTTGLSPHTTSETFSFVGQIIILILIQFGGLGFLTIVIYLWAWLRRAGSLNVEQRLFLHWERGTYKKVESLPVMKAGVGVVLVIELIGAFLLAIFFYSSTPLTNGANGANGVTSYSKDLLGSIWAGIFHSVSAANNAGFDILGKYSIIPYRSDSNNFLSVVLLIESIVGGIGYPVFYDTYMYLKNRKKNKKWNFSLFSKIAIITYLFFAVFGAILVVIFESFGGLLLNSSSPAGGFGWGINELANKVWNLIYLTFSSRSSGFSSIETSELADSTKWLLSILMFIGASPASTGGGIRTITMFIIFARMFYTSLGRKYLSVFNRTIDQSIVYEACNVFILSTLLLSLSIIALMISHPSSKINEVVFETASSFGTAGLTSGFIAKSNFFSKTIFMILMFIGQLGVSNALLSITDLRSRHKNRRYFSENVRIV